MTRVAIFERFLRENQAVQLYGKLPLAKDYLRVGANKGNARALREWLDAAFSTRASQSGVTRFPWPARFVIGDGADEPVMGSVWPSSDTGGERPFPFAVFLERRRKPLANSFAEGFRGLREVWSRLEDCYEQRGEFRDGESFLAGMRGREIPIRSEAHESLERIRWETWTGVLWPDEPNEGLVRVLTSLHRLSNERGHAPIRLPLVGDLPGLPQVHAWWSALVGTRLCPPTEVPTVFFPRAAIDADESAFCVFFRAPLRAEDALWLNSARGQANLGRSDFCVGLPRFAGEAEPATDAMATLADSMRGALASARART